MELHPYKRGFDDGIVTLQQHLAETTLLLEVLAYVNSLITTTKSLESFCISVSKILREKFKYKYIHIWVREEKKPDMLRLVTPEVMDNYRTADTLDIYKGIIGKTIRENRTICLPDVTTDPDYIKEYAETKSELCVPLRHEGKPIGIINIETDIPQTFANHIALIELIAANLGHAVKLSMLYQTEEYFHRLVENMTEGVWVGDREERTLYTNPALNKILGYSAEEMLGTVSYDYFDEASKKIVQAENEKRKLGIGGHYEATYITKTGEHVPVFLHAVPWGTAGGTMATITDLRHLKTTEKKLLRAERFLASITQYCHEAIVGLDKNGIIQGWNVGASRMFGFKTEEVTGKSMEIIVPEDKIASGESKQLLNETKIKGFVRNFETMRMHKNGKSINVSLTASVVKDDSSTIIGISVLYRDITTQKKWEKELQDRFEKIQEAYKEMGRQRRYLDYLMDMVTMSSSTGHTQKQISTFIVNAIIMISRVDGATLRLLDSENSKLVLTAISGLSEDWWTKKTILYEGSLLENAVKKGGPLKILDILNDPLYTSPSLARKNNLRSALVIPLEAKGELLGSLTLYLSNENNLSLLDDEFIMIFAKQAAVALKLAI